MTELPADVHEAFKEGKFAIRRAAGTFNGVWSDMGIESTVIRDAKSSGGIVGLTRKESALLRWTITRQSLGEYASAIRSRSGTIHKDDMGHEQMRPAALNRDEQHVQRLICHVEDNMTHPFRTTDHPDEHLVNISSGVIASKDIQKSLLSVHDLGKRQMEEYITESLCTGGQRSMYQPIPKSKLKTFSISKKKTKILILGQKALVAINPEMVFRRALLLTQVRPDLNMKHVLSYPITSVPTSIFHEDGAPRKNTKAELGHILEGLVDEEHENTASDNQHRSVYIRDAMAELHILGGNGGTFGNLAQCYLNQLLHCIKTHHTLIDVFDQYDDVNSVKTDERTRRLAVAGGSRSYQVIAGRPVPQWTKFMALSSNKSTLTHFICSHVTQHAPAAK